MKIHLLKLDLKMKYLILFFIFIAGCSDTDINDSTKKSIKLSYIYDMKNRIFSDYNLIHDGDVVAAYSTISIFYIAEQDFNEKDYSLIKPKLIKNDWKFIREVNGKDIYCSKDGEKTIVIAKPLTELEDSSSGALVVRTKNQWNIGFYYGLGVSKYCKL